MLSEKDKVKYREILGSLNQYLLKRFNYIKPPARFGLSEKYMDVKRVKVDLYLRFFDVKPLREKPTIVIARIGFREQRNGHGRAFLQFISEIAVKYQYEFIELESCNSNSRAFAKKFGFTFLDAKETDCRIEAEKLRTYFYQ